LGFTPLPWREGNIRGGGTIFHLLKETRALNAEGRRPPYTVGPQGAAEKEIVGLEHKRLVLEVVSC